MSPKGKKVLLGITIMLLVPGGIIVGPYLIYKALKKPQEEKKEKE